MNDWYMEDKLAAIKEKRRKVLIAAIVCSIVFHILSFVNLDNLAFRLHMSQRAVQREPVKVNIVSKPLSKDTPDQLRKLIETPS